MSPTLPRRIIVALVILMSVAARGQDPSDDGVTGTTPPASMSPAPAGAEPAAATARAARPSDPFLPGWPHRFKTGMGLSTSFTGTTNALIYETGMNEPVAWSYYLGFSKAADTYSSSSESTTSGTTTTTSETVESRTGAKNPFVLSLGAARHVAVFRNPFIVTRWGFYGGLDYYTDAKYGQGSRKESSSSATPGTVDITETTYGDVKVSRSPVLRFGPVVDSFVLLRWFPNLIVGFQGGILLSTSSKTTTKKNGMTRKYSVVNGVDQAPTSSSESDSEVTTDTGLSANTFAVAGQTFNAFGNFTLRYVW